jgi:hypothetical protein
MVAVLGNLADHLFPQYPFAIEVLLPPHTIPEPSCNAHYPARPAASYRVRISTGGEPEP